MKSIQRYGSLLKNAGYIFFIKLFPGLAAILVVVFYARQLSPEMYGAYQSFWVKLLLTGTIAYIGLPVVLLTYPGHLIKYLAIKIPRKFYVLAVLWTGICGLAFAWLCWYELKLPVGITVFLPVLYAIHAIQEAFLMAAKKMTGLLWVSICYGLYFLLIHYYALLDYDFELLIRWTVAGMFCRLVWLTIIQVKVFRKLSFRPLAGYDLHKIKQLWLHLGFYDLIQSSYKWIDKFILSIMLPASLFGIYFQGAQEIPVLPYLIGAISTSVLIQMAGDRSLPENKKYQLMKIPGKILAYIVYPLFFFLFIYAPVLFDWLFAGKYNAAVPVFRVAILVLPLRTYSYTMLLQYLHLGKALNKGVLGDLFIAVLLMYPLYLLAGLPGIAFAFVISTYLQIVYYVSQACKNLSVNVWELLPLRFWLIQLGLQAVLAVLLYLAATHLAISGTGLIAWGLGSMVILAGLTLSIGLKQKRI